jgi:carbon monoxide dehydrogenase subunit G
LLFGIPNTKIAQPLGIGPAARQKEGPVQLENTFTVPVALENAWTALLDVERIAPCMPGAELVGRDGDAYNGRVKLKIGPITAAYSGTATIQETDPAARTLSIVAAGKEQRGSGTAKATVRPRLVAVSENETRVEVVTDLEITGKAAQFGRGIIAEVSARLVDQFAANLAAELVSPRGPEQPPAAAAVGVAVDVPHAGAPEPTGSPTSSRAETAPTTAPHAVPAGGALDLGSLVFGGRSDLLKGFALGVLVVLALRGLGRGRR